jgi:hypothetical protein
MAAKFLIDQSEQINERQDALPHRVADKMPRRFIMDLMFKTGQLEA